MRRHTIIILSNSCGHGDRAELIAITVAHHRPVNVRIGHTRRRRTVKHDRVASSRSHYFVARQIRKLRQLGHSETSRERESRAILIGRVALVPALVGCRRVCDDQRAGIAFNSYAIVLRTRVVDAFVFGPSVAGRRVAFRYAWYFDVDARIEYNLFISLLYY